MSSPAYWRLGHPWCCVLKIEGRLKSAAWVSRAVELYRLALDGKLTDEDLANASLELGGYAGRQMSDAFYQGTLGSLTGEGARVARPETGQETSGTEGANESVNSLSIIDDPAGGTLFNFSYRRNRNSASRHNGSQIQGRRHDRRTRRGA